VQQIIVYCPECQSRYQLHADLRGRRMRCPNAACRTTFVVREATGGPPADPDNGPLSADVRGKLVPMPTDNGAGRATEVAPAPEEVLDWQSVPPPVQAPGAAPLRPDVAIPAPESPVLGEPAAAPAPPRRRRSRQVPVAAPAGPRPPARSPAWDEELPPRRTGRKLLMVVLGLSIAVMGGVLGWAVVSRIVQAEDNLRAAAEADYQGGIFRNAAKKYHELAENYGRSSRAAEYRFLADLSDLRELAARTPPEPGPALDAADAFVDRYARDPLLKGHRDDLGQAVQAVATGIADAAETAVRSSTDLESVPDLLKHSERALGLLGRYPARDTDTAALRGRFDQLGKDLTVARRRRQAVAEVLALLNRPAPDVNAARDIIRRERLETDRAVAAALDEAERKLRALVAYEPLNRAPLRDGPADGPPSLLLEPYPPLPETRTPNDVVLAVARGLLYALDGRDGRRLWAARVGLDAGDLPVRVPARGDEPELVLVAGTDPPGLTARDARTGAVCWHQPLEEPCLGRPAGDAAGRLFVPAAGPRGLVYDLDARTGRLHGRFEAHQPLAAGAAFDATTGRLYVPAHGQHVYVFNYDSPSAPRCEGLLTTGHAAGALRGEPIVVSGEEGVQVPRYLVLGEADGLGAMKLRAFRLLDAPTEAVPPAEVRLPGWSWFPPYHDPEKLALATDAGALGLFGIRQAGNDDPPLFPLLGQDLPPAGAARRPARAQLVHAEEYGFWVLAGGALQHWRLGLDRQQGRRLTPVWGTGLRLGSPLHAGQVSADRSTLYLVTQTDAPPSHRATAVDARTRHIHWQRPLGLTPQGDPVEIGGQLLVLDRAGGLYRFDPARHAADPPGPWQSAGEQLAPPLSEVVGESYLLRAAGGQSVVALLCRPAGAEVELVLRRVAVNSDVTAGTVRLPAPPAGTPALGPTAVVLPLADGQLARVPLDHPRHEPGPSWRLPGARPETRAHVVPWRGDEYLVSDGSRRLWRLTWPGGTSFNLDRERPLELAQRVVGAPVRLPGPADGPPTVALADAGGTVTLVRGERPTPVRSWRPGGAVTAGPWAVGDRIAVVLDRHRLAWLDPDQDAPAWVTPIDGDGVEAPPRLADGKLVVADLAGQFVALDPATGRALGAGYRHPAEVAPASAVAAFGPGRLFAPLTDGTVLLLPLADLERPANR
jgi:outer membrane protein assembly factor BamB